MGETNTNGWMVVQGDHILAEEYAGELEPATLHLLMSVSKSILGILVGALTSEGVLNVEEPVTTRPAVVPPALTSWRIHWACSPIRRNTVFSRK